MDLLSGERILFQGHPSWRSQLSHFILWVPLALAPFLIAAILANYDIETLLPVWQWFVVSAILVGVVIVVDAVRRIATFYVVTNQRLRVRQGLLSRKEQTARFDRVQNVDVSQTLADRLLKVGTVDFDTAGAVGEPNHLMFRGIHDPQSRVRIVAENSDLGGGRSGPGI
ncbi:MAG: PH domain-containing protein [Miltoncostaeaceae bacterium]